MICKDCANEADWQATGMVPADDFPGHKDCTGCDCQHLPVGSRQIVKSDG